MTASTEDTATSPVEALSADEAADAVANAGNVWVKAPDSAGTPAATTPAAAEPDKEPAASEPPPEGSIVPDPPRTEQERMDPIPIGPVMLATGTEVEIVPMRLRQCMSLLRILTHGGQPYQLAQLVGDLDFEKPTEFAQTLVAMTLFAIPDAEEEMIAFLRSMVVPTNIDHLSAKDQLPAKQMLFEELENPDLPDAFDIITMIVRRESEDIRSLGKKLRAAFSTMKLTGQLKNVKS